MSGSKTKTGANKTRQGQTRTYRVSPLVRAMRMTFAASLALTGTGMAFAGTCTVPAPSSVECTGAFTDSIAYSNVPDLTLVLGPGGVPTSVIPAAGAIGVDVTSPGNIGISSFADITTDGASGIHTFGADSAAITNSGNINTTVSAAGARALDISAVGDVNVTNTGNAYADGTGVYDVTAIRAESTGTGYMVGVDNQASGKVKATSADGFAIGIYGYATSGDISINNDGAVSATSTGGLADGIFASGVNVDVTNGATGSIDASGFNWAAGIEAQSTDLTTVSNSGDITATAVANDETNGIYGQAFGIYASGTTGADVTNGGAITADGVFASGVFVQAGGSATVTNTGDITVGSNPALITYYGTGIHASNAYENSAVVVTNSGNLSVYGYLGSTGIEAAATGAGSTVSVTNSGSIAMTGSYGTGILASGDGDTSIANSGSISSLKGDGAVALAFNGTASVTNSGDISAYVYGITASSQNGAGYVNNSGTVETSAAVQTFGIYASGGTGATVINTGSVTAGVASAVTQYSSKYSNGIFTHASLGDASVSNSGAVVTEGGKYGRGILAIASQGDVAVTNAAGGSIAVNQGKYAAQQVGTGVASLGYGIEGVSYQGDVSIDNAGSVTVASTRSFGLFGLSGAGNVSVSNSGTVDVYGFVKQIGVQAQAIGGNVTVDNSGTITASATGNYAFPENNKAFGIVAYASGGDINVSNEGTITAATGTGGIIDSATYYVIPAGDAVGISATSPDGNISVSNTGTITATSNSGEATALDRYGDVAVAGNAFGIYAAGTGDTSVSNDGTITATSTYGLADGIFATGTNVDVTNGATGSITVNGFNWAAGVEAQSYDLTTVSNSGDIHATATANDETNAIYGHAYGIFASGGVSGVNSTNSGHITADGVFATGVLAQGGGPVTVSNSGDITIGADPSLITTYYATGIQATNNYENSSIAVDNSGSIAVNGEFGANGIAAAATGIDSTVSVTNAGAISVSSSGSDYSNGSAILASGDAGASVHNAASGTIFASGNGYAYGVQALTFNGDANVVNDGSVMASADGNAKYSAYAVGVLASSTNGNATVSNTGSISANAASQASAASRGIYATGVAADVFNSGTITTYGGSSLGIGAVGTTGDVTVLNQGSIHATGNKYSSGTGISVASTYGDVSVTNSSDGDIVALGTFGANGMQARSFYGDVNVVNAGTIEVGSSDPSTLNQPNAIGIYAGSRTGNVSVVNSGTILAQTAANPTGIHTITTGDGTTTVDNSGTIQAIGQGVSVWGVYTQAFGGGDIAVHNSGTIEASTGAFHATGIWGCAGTYDYYAGGCTATGDVSVVNDGTITASSRGDDPSYTGALSGSRASGIWVYGENTEVANTGNITADGFAWASGIEANGTGQTLVTNSGDISVIATADDATSRIHGQAFGIKASGGAGGVSVTNSGGIDATAPFNAFGIYAAAVDGDIGVSNKGAITVTSTTADGLANGIYASGANVGVSTGAASNITAISLGDAYGIHGDTATGDISVSSGGAISATSSAGIANGIFASGVNVGVTSTSNVTANAMGDAFGIQGNASTGDIGVSNGGAISATSSAGIANGIFASGVNVGVISTGNITAAAQGDAFGIQGDATTGDIHVSSDGAVSATSSAGIANGILASGLNVGVASAGNITTTALGDAFGIHGEAAAGDISVSNSGAITTTSTDGQADGILATGQTVGINHAGAITTTSDVSDAHGINAAGVDSTKVANSGSITANAGYGYAFGVYAKSNGDIAIGNSGHIDATATHRYATGIYGGSQSGNVSISSSGSISAYSPDSEAVGMAGASYDGNVAVSNAGTIDAMSRDNNAIGMIGNDLAGNVAVSTAASSAITATAQGGDATGILGFSFNGDVGISNGGSVTANGHHATGITATALYAGAATVTNSGTIDATSTAGGDAIGVLATAAGRVLVSNTGTITATDDDHAVAVSMTSPAGSTLMNSGTITTVSALEDNIAVQGSASDDAIQNFGDIHGALLLGDGNDSLLNGNRGVWDVRNHATDFGAGDDTIDNAAGGTINLADAAIRLGSSSGIGNAFTNAGTIKVTGSSLIDMGTSDNAVPLAAAFTSTAVPSLNALPLTNNGVIDFRDGQPNDILTVNGDLAGNGQIDLDVSLLNRTSDLLYVNGNVANGAVQAVNVALDGGLPTQEHTPIAFAQVRGDSTSGSFVKGHVTDLSPRNFLDMQVNVSSKVDASNASADVFSVDLEVAGLNDFGTLAASIVPGANSLINSQIGTWRQRMGVVPAADNDQVSVAPWVRAFSDSGSVDPRHTADNFGQSGHFGYDQSNSGQELGLNLNLQGGFSLGALLGQSEGHQHLNGLGYGSDRIEATSYGLYGTWMSPKGVYVDASYRRVDFKANLRSIGGEHRANGVGDAFNLEAGYTAATLPGGVDLTPQFQYSWTSIHSIDTLSGDRFNFASDGGVSWRARLGLAFSKTINGAGIVWTPYGSLNAIREMDGQTRYLVADQFTGTTSTKGTSGMVELGLGAQKGKLSVTGGVNWTDGGAQQNLFGGQLVLRYTF